ncbi:MAG TPA: HIT family protein [Candidatus Paceibacterota bacterium]
MSTPCPFCNKESFKERIVLETKQWYVIASLGQITSGYLLVFPKEHHSCFGAMSELSKKETSGQRAVVCHTLGCLEQEYWGELGAAHITLFEHGIVGQSVPHAHLHVLPVRLDLTPRVQKDFTQCEIVELENPEKLQLLWQKQQKPYLLWSNGNGKPMVCWNPPAPKQYFRTVVAEILGYPNRADWKTMDPALDKRMWQGTVERLKRQLGRTPYKNT